MDLQGFSDVQSKVITDIFDGDKGFHTNWLVADTPFSGMAYETEEGVVDVQKCAEASVSDSSGEYRIQLYFSDERNCWFFTVFTADDSFSGVLHFNTLYNAKGMFSFVFLNDSVDAATKTITMALPFSNFLLLRR